MRPLFHADDTSLFHAFKEIAEEKSFQGHIRNIAHAISINKLSKSSLQEVLENHGISEIESIKHDLMDMLLYYSNIILDDRILDEREEHNFEILKLLFKIREGDFLESKQYEVEKILHRQFEYIYADNLITFEEKLHKFGLQAMFDLGYDDFEDFKKKFLDAKK